MHTLANSEDPDEMQHLGLNCLQRKIDRQRKKYIV